MTGQQETLVLLQQIHPAQNHALSKMSLRSAFKTGFVYTKISRCSHLPVLFVVGFFLIRGWKNVLRLGVGKECWALLGKQVGLCNVTFKLQSITGLHNAQIDGCPFGHGQIMINIWLFVQMELQRHKSTCSVLVLWRSTREISPEMLALCSPLSGW